MAGVGTLLKQAKKMQNQMQALQESFGQKKITVSSGGGAVTIDINLHGEVQGVKLDPEFIKEDLGMIEDTLTAALQEAYAKAKSLQEEETAKVTAGFNLPGFPSF